MGAPSSTAAHGDRRSAADRKAPAVVVALDCVTGLQTARILAGHDVPVLGVASDRNHFAARTRAARQVIGAPTSGEGLIRALERLGPTLGGPAFLVPCSDGAVLAISRWRDRLAAQYRFVLPDHDVVEMLMDKVRFAEYAASAELPIPPTFTLRSRADAQRAAVALPYPAVVKPAFKSADWLANTKDKAIRVESPAELLDVYERGAAWSDVLLAQAWIDGEESDLYSCNVYYDRSGVSRVAFVARKIRQWPPRTGVSSLGEEVRNEAVRAAALRLFSGVGYRGLGYVELKRDARTGEHLIVEPNIGRPTGRSAIAEEGGVELVYTAYCDALGLPLPDRLEQRFTGARWIYWRHDLQSALYYWRHGELSLVDWWRSIQGRKREAVFSLRDPLPFVGDVAGAAGVALRRAGATLARRRRPEPAARAANIPTVERA